ncbi:MAG TPA: GH25 family lysozyme [Polyangiales bacterium]|jgi:GH25 family lysozyme M1 (1,4-beta-N-acetylmuramidase)|nr:GH25 family lysozyme [Polyangiales bacterium]
MNGISLSVSANDAIDWPRLRAAGFTFALLRASVGGTSYAGFDAHWPAMREVGLRRCAAHVFRPDQDPIVQAVRFLKIQLSRGDLPPVLDIDEVESKSLPTLVAAIHEWLAVVEGELDARHGARILPMIRTSDKVWRRLGQPSGFDEYPLWIVDHVRLHDPHCPSPWNAHQWTFHQYMTQTPDIPGVRSGDLARFNVLGLADRGLRVGHLKRALRDAGYEPSDGDELDERTRRHLLHYQASRQQIQTGLVDVETFAALHWP